MTVPVDQARLIGSSAARRCGRSEVEPVALVYLVGNECLKLVEELARAAVEDELEQEVVGLAEQLHARGLVDAARLDADEAVLHGVQCLFRGRALRRRRSPSRNMVRTALPVSPFD